MKDINLVLENIVYMELLRRGYTVTVGKAGDKEIDFVCEDQGNKLYIQVAYLLASEDTIEREFGVYDRIRDNFPKYVITLDEFDMSRNGIKHRNIRDFLLPGGMELICHPPFRAMQKMNENNRDIFPIFYLYYRSFLYNTNIGNSTKGG